jgi:hypothetical protein
MQETAHRSQPAGSIRHTIPWRSLEEVSTVAVFAETLQSRRHHLSARGKAGRIHLLWAKRPFDLLLSGLGLLTSAPLWGLIA